VNNKKLFILLISVTLFLGFFTQEAKAQTQGSIQFDSVAVNLFPEFNQPSIYVTFDIELTETLLLPRTLTFQIPANIDDFVVLYLGDEGFFESPEVMISQDRLWKYVNFSTPSPTIRVEYTDPNLVFWDNYRSYTFRWTSLYPAFYFSLRIHQPEGISQFEVDKDILETEEEISGIKTSTIRQSPFPSGKLFELSFSYAKTGEIVYPGYNVEAGDEISEKTPGKVPSPLNLVFWLFSIALFIIIIIGLYFFWFKKRTAKSRGLMVQGVGIMNPEKMAVFCHECGMRSRPGDSYCSNCGTILRKPTNFIGSNH
jgi:hypothetical protein